MVETEFMRSLVIFFLLIGVAALAGCAKLQYIDEALRLKGYAAEKDAQAVDIKAKDVLFDKMLARVKSGENVTLLGTGAALIKTFGEPVLVLPAVDHPGYEEWLYRHQIQKDHGPKIYVMVAPNGRLVEARVQDAR